MNINPITSDQITMTAQNGEKLMVKPSENGDNAIVTKFDGSVETMKVEEFKKYMVDNKLTIGSQPKDDVFIRS